MFKTLPYGSVFFCIKFTPRKFVNSLLRYPKGKIINPKITFSIKNVH